MAMTLTQFSQLKKMMALTISDNDAEALASIRAANSLLIKCGYTWELVFSSTVQVINEVEPAETTDEELEEAFAVALRDISGSFRATLLDIQRQWTNVGWISGRQRQVVMDAARRRS